MAGARAAGGAAQLRAARRTAAAGMLGVGLTGLLLFGLGRAHPLQALGGGLTVAGAAAVLGGALGFLFGVPRMRSGEQPGPAGGPVRDSYVPNTNLEQVSDWLTKVLLGVGLTQLGSLGARLHQLGAALAPALGGDPGAAPFAAALVLYFLVLGFLAGWLATRLLLPRALSDADRALDLFLAGQDRDRKGDKVGADDLRVRAMQRLGLLGTSTDRPETVREQLPPAGDASPENVVAEVRSTARRSALTAGQVRELFADGSEGRRVQALALMQGDPALADLDSVLEAIERPRSGFEQYHALLAARGLLSRLAAGEWHRLRDAVASQLVAPEGIPYGSDRSWLAEKILARVDAAPVVPHQSAAPVQG
ncbi:hypothetical protein GCM10010495_56470 [Kitasatospora herbaricolor]|uniref:hypothetical protein n=1 Tax=Kitasatospora herbaricolor TaxID=68217 RepID=UPI0017483ABE|nr:hypothetical protein [Kitasatospora herbaricolor]MDQ0309956.1 hypothetical protein [Kitasatospora herbaricolor]GGV32440.1 hypothetical protein GCM10010495_56470 [Kitasatospora herbaricolor]